MMDRTNRRNLVKIRRLAEEAMLQADYLLDYDRAWSTACDIIYAIDECLERNGQPYTNVEHGYGIPTSKGLHKSEEPEEEGYVCCS